VSPEIQSDRRVTFRLAAPEATKVTLDGDWPDGSVVIQKDGRCVWSATVGPLAPELWQYTFTVDGVRTLDPANVDSYRDGRRLWNIFIVFGPASALYEPRHRAWRAASGVVCRAVAEDDAPGLHLHAARL
jgi:1,4-alpha-glucan branching enzyme